MRTIQINDKTYAELARIGLEIRAGISAILEYETAAFQTPEDVIPFLTGYYLENQKKIREKSQERKPLTKIEVRHIPQEPIIDADEVQKKVK
jgi:hypothetical protein